MGGCVEKEIRILMLEDQAGDARLLELELRQARVPFRALRVDTREAFERALEEFTPHLILADFTLPGFDGLTALKLLQQSGRDLPFLIVSGEMGEEAAIDAIHQGATDCISKNRLTRLAPSVLRALREADERTARRQAESALRRRERYFRMLIENASDIITVIAADGTMRYGSPSTERILGHKPESLHGKSAYDFVHPDDLQAVRDTLGKALDDADMAHAVEFRFLHHDGSWRTLAAVGKSLRETSGERAVVVNSRDVTERKMAEEALLQSEATLRQSQKMEAIGRLAGGVAHDFNNLLAVILNYAGFVAKGLKSDDPLRSDVEEIREAAKRAASLTRQLLIFSRKELIRPKAMNLNDVVADTEKLLQRTIGEDIDLHCKLHPELDRVMVDRGHMEQVLLNLAVNARDAMPNGGRLSIETSNASLDEQDRELHPFVIPGRYVCLSVTDTGCGMSEAVKSHVFEPYFTTKAKGKGTGLGLATVYGIVKQAGGYIWLYSEPGSGTTFRIYVPVTDKPASVEIRATPPPPLPGRGETVLVVEDENALRAVARRILARNGYKVLEAPHGPEAMALSDRRTGAIDLLLTDVIMPRMSGKELAHRLLKQRPRMRVLYMSGYTDDVSALRRELADGVPFLQKPFTEAGLLSKVREVLDECEPAPVGAPPATAR
jgi:hypothetical protein